GQVSSLSISGESSLKGRSGWRGDERWSYSNKSEESMNMGWVPSRGWPANWEFIDAWCGRRSQRHAPGAQATRSRETQADAGDGFYRRDSGSGSESAAQATPYRPSPLVPFASREAGGRNRRIHGAAVCEEAQNAIRAARPGSLYSPVLCLGARRTSGLV